MKTHVRSLLAVAGACAVVGGGLASCQSKTAEDNPAATSGSPAAAATKFLKTYEFDAAAFQKPALEFGPFTRWWWPGGDVDSTELRREVKMLADNGFAGAEIQPFTFGLNMNGAKDRLDRVYSWDTPAFYAKLRAALAQAETAGFTLDLNGGSGWPLGGPSIKADDGMLTLTHADTVVAGGQKLTMPVPHQLPPNVSVISILSTAGPGKYRLAAAQLQAVVAARVTSKTAGQTQLDPTTVVDLTKKVQGKTLSWQAPAGGQWAIMAFYGVPDDEPPVLVAKPEQGFVVNHFDSTKLAAAYEHLLGKRTGLAPYYGRSLRGIFNDSYELKPDRHFAKEFLSYFQQQRGYDARTALPAQMQTGYNNAYASFMLPGKKPDFVFADGQDWRRRYDYDQTVGDLFRRQFIGSSNRWMAAHGLMHRTQAYGVRMDVLEASGLATQPEAEQLAYQGSEGFIKLVTAGAHQHNRPVISQESFVFMGRADMTTPQKIKALTDKALTAGINQIIYHGTPYKYQTGEYGREGWNTWANPFMPINFSSGMNESDPFWPNIKTVNQYIARAQYALRAGRPHTDVLVYFPSISFTDNHILTNPEEILTGGIFKGVEPESKGLGTGEPTAADEKEIRAWFAKTWPVINALEAAGITWEWTNDASLQAATLKNGLLDVRGNQYQAVLLTDAPYLRLASAQHLSELAGQGAKIVSVGALPTKQPNFQNYAANDQKTAQLVAQAVKTKLASAAAVPAWAATLAQPIGFAKALAFTREIEREMTDGSRLRFIANKTAQWQTLALKADASFGNLYWLDASTGAVTKANPQELTYQLPPYGSVFFYAAKVPLAASLVSSPVPVLGTGGQAVASLTKWDVKAGSAAASGSPLFDWRSKPAFQHISDEGVYTATFDAQPVAGQTYFLDLGQVFFTADVQLNGQPAGSLLWAPYQLDVTKLLKAGANKLEVRVMPSRRNEFIGQATKGNPKYVQFKGQEKTLMPAGLVGPVSLRSMPASAPQ